MADGSAPDACMDEAAAARSATLRDIVAGVDLTSDAAPTVAVPGPAWGSAPSTVGNLLRTRTAQTYRSTATQVAQYETNKAPANLAVGNEIDVLVAPFRGIAQGDNLVLVRSVRVGTRLYRQGIVLDAVAFADALTHDVMADAASVFGPARISWVSVPDGAPTSDAQVRLAAPFSTLVATIAGIERDRGGGRAGIAAVGILGLLMGASALLVVRRNARAELDLASRRTNFVSAVSHELKTPLTAIRMYAEMLRDGMVPSDDKKTSYYVTIAAESERLSRLIQNVLDLGRIERGTWQGSVGMGELAPVLDRLTEVMGPYTASAGFTLRVDAAPGLPPARMDPDALLQVLVNVVENAVKFAAAAEVRTIEVHAVHSGNSVVLTVRDHGPGVSDRALPRIFDLF